VFTSRFSVHRNSEASLPTLKVVAWVGFFSNIYNNNNNNRVDIYGAVIMASRCESSPGSFDECRLSAKVATNPQTKPTDLDCESAERKAATVHIHHRHFIITQPGS